MPASNTDDGWVTDDTGTELFVGQQAIWCDECVVWWPCDCDERAATNATVEVVGPDARPVREDPGTDADDEQVVMTDGSGTHPTESRPGPEDDPHRCSICGGTLGLTQRVQGEDVCDSCQSEYGFGEDELVLRRTIRAGPTTYAGPDLPADHHEGGDA